MSGPKPGHCDWGFTLFEIMIVVAILGILVTMGVPLVNRVRHRQPLNQAVRDIFEVCGNARARAILQGKMAEVIFHPAAGTFEVAGGAPAPRPADESLGLPPERTAPSPDSGLSGQIDLKKISLEMLDVNLTEYKDREFARVRFYPNGTSDEMTIVLHSDRGEWIKVSLDLATGLASAGPVDK